MAPTFATLETPAVVRTLAAGALTQLWRNASFLRAGVTDVKGVPLSTSFEKGENVRIRRAKDPGLAQDYDPRTNVDATTYDTEYVVTDITLRYLFTQGFRVYSHDANVKQYVSEFSEVVGGSVRRSFDNALYADGFRDWTRLPSTGTVFLGTNAPTQIVYSESASGVMNAFGDNVLTAASATLDRAEVPSEGRYGRVTPDSGLGIERDATLVTGFAGSMASSSPGTNIIVDGIPVGVDFSRRMFAIAKSNAVTGQTAVANIGDGAATSTVSAAVADTTVFFQADTSYAGSNIPAGAVRLTIGTTAALNAGVAVGTICRLGATNAPALAYGVILRVDPVGKFVWMIPYNSDGVVLTAAQIPGSTVFSIPRIGAVNPFFHQEHLVYATRLIEMPSPGSGAYGAYAVDPQTRVAMQVLKGSYQINQFKEGLRGSILCGAAPSDSRKAVLALAAA
jgi:hypothetical protein